MASNNNFTLNGSNPLGNQTSTSSGVSNTQIKYPTSGMTVTPTATNTVSSTPVSSAPKPVTSGLLNTSNNGSVVDYLNSQGKASDYNSRAGLASQYGISGYSGTAEQNTSLLNALRGGSSPAPTNPGVLNNSPLSTPQAQNTQPAVQSQPTQPTTPAPYTPNPQLQGQLITGLANMSQQPGEAYNVAQGLVTQRQQELEKIREQAAQSKQDIFNQAIPLEFTTGQNANLQQKYLDLAGAKAQELNQAQGQVTSALTAQQQQQQALQQAGSLNAPQFPSYASQVYNPSTGFLQGGNTLNDAVSTVVQRVKSGQMSYADAVSALSGYGQGGVNALQQSLGSDFNVAQSNTLAAQQGSIGPALQYANTALGNLENSLSGLMAGQSTNVPIINQITQGLSTQFGIGSQGVQNYKAAIAEARNAIQSVLASVRGGTPTDYVGQSNTLLPDNATPNQIKAARETLTALGTAKQEIYGNPGASGSSSSGSSLYSW